ncbi:MAG TPA: hypothetical protein VGF21_10145 [Thermoleophilaceae bacterium]|jgi:hypothetical protein
MRPDRLRLLMEAVPVPAAKEARERTVAAARAEVGQRSPTSVAPRRRGRVRLLVAVALLLAAALSPPGRAATGWLGEVIGGEGPGGLQLTTRPTVVARGDAPDGTRYEWIAYGCKVNLHGEGVPVRFRGFSLSLDWPAAGRRIRDASCEGRGRPAVRTVVSPGFLRRVPSGDDLYVSGRTTVVARRLRAVYTDRSGRQQELPVDLARPGRQLRERAGLPRPLGAYVVFVPARLAARGGLQRCVGFRARSSCAKHPGARSPIELIAYGREGRELQRIGVPLSAADQRALLPHAPSESEILRGVRRARRGAVVLLRGRAPEGALYEVTIKLNRERSGRVFGVCTDLWWPHVPRTLSGGYCGPRIPPPAAFGHRHPEQVGAKGFGFLGDAQPATSRLTLSGYARGPVARVRVVYKARDGTRRDAPIDFVNVRGALRRRVAAKRSFGFWMAFLPRYLAGARGRHAIDVIAYGDRGQELSRVAQATSPVNGLRRRR